jgi:RNA recognition motif-containing protein
MNIYVGNLSYGATEDQLRAAFVKFGNVSRVNLIIDRETGRSKGFGFVEMPDDSAAEAAIKALNGAELDGRSMKVSEARPRERRTRF